jgi:hypothetical protein
MGRVWLVVAALACGLIGGCADTNGGHSALTPPDVTGTSRSSVGSCPPANVQNPSRAILRTFVPVAAVWCQESEQDYPSDGRWSVMIRKQTTGNLNGLLAAFLQPNDAMSNGPCAADLRIGPLVELVDADGHYVIPAYPRDECGQPKQAVISLVERDAWKVVATTKEHQLVSEAALTAGCEMQWKNELSYLAGVSRLPRATPLFPHDSKTGEPARVHVPDSGR